MATTLELQQLYLAYFGRPPEPAALAYYRDFSVAQVEAAFEASPEANQVYATSGGKADAAMVITAYQHLFNRVPSAAEVQYWVGAGASQGLTPSALSILISANTQGTDTATVANRMAYVQQWVDTFSARASDIHFDVAAAAKLATQQLGGITDDPASLNKAVTATDIALTPGGTSGGDTTGGSGPVGGGSGPAPVTNLVLTTAATDVVVGTAGNDVINATTGASGTLNVGDTIDGKGGIDTLSIVNVDGLSFTLSSASVTNIEKLQLTTPSNKTFAVNATGITGLTDVINDSSGNTVSVTGLGNLVNVAVEDTHAATSIRFANGVLDGSGDALTLALQDATGGALVTLTVATANANELETLNIVSSGTANNIKLVTDTTQTSLHNINISGAAPLTLDFNTNFDHAVTFATNINSSTATGGVTIGSSSTPLGAASHSITLGTGHNVVYFGENLDSTDTINATAGTDDTVVVTSVVAAGAMGGVTGVDTMRFMNTTGMIAQDVTLLAGAPQLQIAGAGSAVTFSNLASGTAVDVLGGWNLGMVLTTNGFTDALTIRLTPDSASGVTLSTLSDVYGLEVLNIVSNGFAGQTVANVITNDATAATQVLTGSADLTITSALATNSFDASAFTGNLTVIAHGSMSPVTTKGGSGNDKITLNTGQHTVSAGAGNDTIYTDALNTSAHTIHSGAAITTGSGNDTIVFVDNRGVGNGAIYGIGVNPYTGISNITAKILDFTVGTTAAATDKLAFSGNDLSYQLTSNDGAGTAATGLAKGAVAQGLMAGDTMVVQDVAKDDTMAAASDVSFIKLTTAGTFDSDIKSLFASAIGTGSITGLAHNGNYVVAVNDSVHNMTTIAVVNTGGNADGDTTLSADDFRDADIAVVGTLSMTNADYANFGALHLATVL